MMLVMSTEPLFDIFRQLGIQKGAGVMKIQALGQTRVCRLTPSGASGAGTRHMRVAMTGGTPGGNGTANFYLLQDEAALLFKLNGIAPNYSTVWMAHVGNAQDLTNLCLALDCDGRLTKAALASGSAEWQLNVCNDDKERALAVANICDTAMEKFGALFEHVPERFLTYSKPVCCLQMLLEEYLGKVYTLRGAVQH
jgi:hypothetical protein